MHRKVFWKMNEDFMQDDFSFKCDWHANWWLLLSQQQIGISEIEVER